MTDRLDGIRLKRERAWSHLHTLKTEITAFLDGDPYMPVRDFNAEAEQLIIRIRVRRETNPMWSVTIGEIIHNFRCCLDYLACELFYLKNLKIHKAKVQFPIFMDENGFLRHGIKRFLPGIDGTHINMIRSEQPFSKTDGGTGESGKSPLWHLYELSNADKHRTLQLTGTLIQDYRFTFPEATHSFTPHMIECMERGPIQEDAILWRGRLIGTEEWPFAEGDIKGEIAADVAFDDGVPAVGGRVVYSTLADIANRTDRILNRFFKSVWNTQL